jgi:hypothetical protein
LIWGIYKGDCGTFGLQVRQCQRRIIVCYSNRRRLACDGFGDCGVNVLVCDNSLHNRDWICAVGASEGIQFLDGQGSWRRQVCEERSDGLILVNHLACEYGDIAIDYTAVSCTE